MLQPIVCVTGQHREMLDQVLDIFEITPHYDLSVMQPNQTLSTLTANLIISLDRVMSEAKPDWVLVQGDTTSAMAAGLVAFYQGVKIGHIEAGLRTHDRKQPFPEEVNRRITDLMSDLYFTPTRETSANLLREGIAEANILITGNTVIDALITGNTVIDALLMTAHHVRDEPLDELDVNTDGKRMILVTSHRRENPFKSVCRALKMLADRYHDEAIFIFPVHYNPNVREPAYSILGGVSNIVLIDPVNYKTMVKLMARSYIVLTEARSYIVLTDSGGIQEEAPSLHKPLIILRDVTERQEVVTAGAGLLVGCDEGSIVREVSRLMEDGVHYKSMSTIKNPYGDGTSSLQIIRAILIHEGLLTTHGWVGVDEDGAPIVTGLQPEVVYQN